MSHSRRAARDVTTTTESRDAFVLLHRSDGGPDVILYEHRLHYGFLGDALHPTSRMNLATTASRVLALAPGVPVDVALHVIFLADRLER